MKVIVLHVSCLAILWYIESLFVPVKRKQELPQPQTSRFYKDIKSIQLVTKFLETLTPFRPVTHQARISPQPAMFFSIVISVCSYFLTIV